MNERLSDAKTAKVHDCKTYFLLEEKKNLIVQIIV